MPEKGKEPHFIIRMAPEMKEELREAARLAGSTLSGFTREAVRSRIDEVKRENREIIAQNIGA